MDHRGTGIAPIEAPVRVAPPHGTGEAPDDLAACSCAVLATPGLAEHPAYCFPSGEKFMGVLTKARELAPEKLWDLGTRLGEHARRAERQRHGKYRDAACGLAVAVQERGLAAPAFWSPPQPPAEDGTELAETLVRDRKVLDLHHLHGWHRYRLLPQGAAARELFGKETFDFELAADVVSRPALGDAMVRELGVDEPTQLELAELVSAAVAGFREGLVQAEAEVSHLLVNRAGQPRSRIPRKDIPARLREFRCLWLANGSPALAARYWQRMPHSWADRDVSARSLAERFRKRRAVFEDKLGWRTWGC